MGDLLKRREILWALYDYLVAKGEEEKAAEVFGQLVSLEVEFFNLLYGEGCGANMSVVSALMEIQLDTVKRAGSYCEELVKMVKGHLVTVVNEGRREL